MNNKKYYIYKLYFESGKTYVGSHIQKREKDNYITSSSYYKNHPEDKLVKREILIELKDAETMNFIETICILEDKANNPNNVNGNYGNWYYHFCGGQAFKGLKLSKEHKQKISKNFFKKGHKLSEEEKKKIKEKLGYKVYCLETKKVYDSCKDAAFGKDSQGASVNRSAKNKGYIKARDGNHYLYLEEAEEIKDKEKYLQNILQRDFQGEPVVCLEENIYYSSISTAYKLTGISTIYSHLLNKKNYKTAGGYHWKKITLKEFENSDINRRNLPLKGKKYNHNSKKVMCLETGEIFNSVADTGLNRVYKCVNNPNYTAGGYHWTYI